MRKTEYLSETEQYKRILNDEEISRIKDTELRIIRLKYWNLLHEAFLDERSIPDSDIEKVSEQLREKEQQEIAEYRKQREV